MTYGLKACSCHPLIIYACTTTVIASNNLKSYTLCIVLYTYKRQCCHLLHFSRLYMAARQTNNVLSCKLDGSDLVEVLQLSAATAVAIDPKGMFSTYLILSVK